MQTAEELNWGIDAFSLNVCSYDLAVLSKLGSSIFFMVESEYVSSSASSHFKICDVKKKQRIKVVLPC